jgi:hypothetical protein
MIILLNLFFLIKCLIGSQKYFGNKYPYFTAFKIRFFINYVGFLGLYLTIFLFFIDY